ncbi:MAG: ABC transporter ATP-binding protein/permease [Firmicutes bacterium]|nr:ABC transporter ATP-binding protein/permease [Candidatus Fiminaster equi]
MIVIRNLTKTYKSTTTDEDVVALNDLDLFLPDKGFIAIYGASGCGKSTLLNVLGGLDIADKGQMIVNGRDTTGFKAHDWNSYRNQEVGFIFQNYFLLPHLNVYDNIAITLQMSKQTDGMKKRIHDALKEVDLAGFSKRLPRQLSGGQQQRVAIARALVTNPSIILADEPTGALDEKSSKSVMKTLKNISKEHLVVMVTHNERMAREYADRMIEISYGKIVGDVMIQKESDDIVCKSPLLKVHLPLRTSIKWSFRNVIKKKGRSIPIAIASAIGLASAGIVLSMTSGVNDYVQDAQKAAIKDYPVYVTTYPKTSSESAKSTLVEFPETSDIIIEKSDYETQEHYISMQDDFMEYMSKMPKDYYNHITTNVSVNFNLIAESSVGTFQNVQTTKYTSCIAPTSDTYNFINEQYDILAGHLPYNEGDLTLVVDTYNRVDLMNLVNMGFDASGKIIKSEDIVNKKEYHIVSNDDYYEEVDSPIHPGNKIYKEKKGSLALGKLYQDSNKHTLKITGIIRPKYDSPNPLYKTVLLYHPDLLSKVVNQLNADSEIVKKQNEYGVDYDVFEGEPFKDTYIDGYHISANYQLESRLIDIGGKERTTAIYYYTETFTQRVNIVNYVDRYELPKDSNIVLRTKDYLEQVTSSFSAVVDTFSIVLFIFSMVSILVSAILTAILTYISVIERKREIGLLRSLGARKRDVSLMFISEASIIGVAAGVLGTGLCFALAPAVAQIVVNLIDMANTKLLKPTPAQFSHVQPWVIPVILLGAVFIGIIASVIPAIIAGHKKPADSLRE